MQLHIEPDLGIPMPLEDIAFSDFAEKAAAACNTAELLELDTEPTQEDNDIAEQAVYDLAEDPEKAAKKLGKATTKFTPAVYRQVDGILKEYSHRVVDNAMQIRLLVTNKLILETEDEDPKIRLRALELLGKVTDVGLFTEKSEVTVTHRSSEDLVNSIRAKIQKLMQPTEIEDVNEVKVNGEVVNLDDELGMDFGDADS